MLGHITAEAKITTARIYPTRVSSITWGVLRLRTSLYIYIYIYMGLGRKPHNADVRLIVSSTVVTKFTVGPQMGGPGSPSGILIRDCYDKEYDELWQLIAQTQIFSLGP